MDWYAEAHREFPWRETTDPYPILVAEVMSQQTQLDRIVDAWSAFLERWESVEALADAAPGDVIAFWSAHRLGYNRRAEYLHAAATYIVEELDGSFPRDPSGLAELKGVGPYTANAVASFAFNDGGAVVDTNVKRVIHRLYGAKEGTELSYSEAADRLMPREDSRRWNNAIMELGATVCQPTPRCDEEPCPWRAWCAAYASGDLRAPEVTTQPSFHGSRRQFRGRIVREISERGELGLDALGPLVREEFDPADSTDLAWLTELVQALAEDGLVAIRTADDGELRVAPRTR